MKKGSGAGAVIYVRVSTSEQAGPLNLHNQEERCRNYCERNNFNVLNTFFDGGESARSADRPEFQNMLAFCKQNRSEVDFVVVQDLSRFARNLQDQIATMADLAKVNICVRSVYEGGIDETATGKLQASIVGGFNEYFSNSLSEKMKDRCRQAVLAGRFPWKAPIGYRNVGGKEGANIEPDPERAPFICCAFELMATGLRTKADVLKVIAADGLTTGSGKPLSPQTFQMVLRNPLYAGWVNIPSDPDFQSVRGLHQPIVSQELFDRVQAVLDGRAPVAAPKRKFNPDFPLKRIIRCDACHTPLTGGLCGGRSKKYGYYWCRKPQCGAVKVRIELLQKEFVDYLRTLKPDKKAVSSFPKIAARVWTTRQGDIEKLSHKQESQSEDQKALRASFKTKWLRGLVNDDDYKIGDAEYAVEIARLEQGLQDTRSKRVTLDAFIRFSELLLMDIAQAWEIADPEQRQRVQNLLFEGGLHYSPESGILNRSKSSLFSMLEGIKDENILLASPTGFEPVLSP
jgi:DNA invertase Pin-like site-specific DNA recombinase